MLEYLRSLVLLALCASRLFAQNTDESATRLLRFPATNGTEITFSYAGQLYSVPAAASIPRP